MKRILTILGLLLLLGLIILGGFFVKKSLSSDKSSPDNSLAVVTIPEIPAEPVIPPVTHLTTPEPLRALYMSSWIASARTSRNRVVNIIDTTNTNAVVIDIKDATGRVSFLVDDTLISDTGSPENRIRDIRAFIEELHQKNIYVIGRISTFQDPYLAKVKPSWALSRKSDGGVWKDRKGLAFLDPANKQVWDYTVHLARASYDVGFDEINFDYVRYPSDGNIKDINYRLEEGKTRADNLAAFFEYLHSELKKNPAIIMSADLFGMTTYEKTDMGIGQILEKALPYFDYIAPMVYPSHYADYAGFNNPAEHPYEVVLKAMKDGEQKITALKNNLEIPEEIRNRVSYHQLRPWLQDFSIGKTHYDLDKITAQMRAVTDAGLTSWMMWDPANKYTVGAYTKE
jgi:hypothetical protein